MVSGPRRGAVGRWSANIYMACIAAGAVLGLSFFIAVHPREVLKPELLFWTFVLAAVELLPVPVKGPLQLSLAFPIRLAVALLYSPGVAATVAFVGSFDVKEVKREIKPLRSLFNRAQIAVSSMAGGIVFHALARVSDPLVILAGAALLATVALYLVNVTLVVFALRLLYATRFRVVIRELRMGALHEFLLNYMGLALLSVIISRLYNVPGIGPLAVAAFILPLIFARQMFFRTLALEGATKELRDRERVLRALSNRMAEERQDERMQIAAYLHDDLAQMLYRLSLQVEMAKKKLAAGEAPDTLRHLDGIADTKQEASDAIRALIRDLHRSPIGRKGLAEALESFAKDMSGTTRVLTDVVEVTLPPPITLLIYQIAREAVMNALKHAEAQSITISLQEAEEGGVVLSIADDGKGFDPSAPPPEGHFGSVMMRERAMVAGGTYSISSEPGKGTTIKATFPPVWVEEGSILEAAGETQDKPHLKPPIGSTTASPPRFLLRRPFRSRRDQGPPEEEQEDPSAQIPPWPSEPDRDPLLSV